MDLKKDKNNFYLIKTQILKLLESKNQQFIYLTGAAGTGKTTLIEKILDENNLKNSSSSNWCCGIKYRWQYDKFCI